MVESNQRRLTERMDDTNRRHEELGKLLEMQRQTLHTISGLSPGEASKRLLDSLEQELTQEMGSVILRHEKHIAEVIDQKARVMLLTALQRYAAAHTAESTTETASVSANCL